MNRQELVAKVCEDAGLTKKQANAALKAVLDGIAGALSKGDKISLIGFGTFKVLERNARVGINPKTKKKINIPARKVPIFKAGQKLKSVV